MIRTRRSRLIACIVGVLLAACGPKLEDRLTDLVNAKDLWSEKMGCEPYEYAMRAGNGPWLLATISEPCREPVRWFDSTAPRPAGALKPTIIELFALSLHLIEEQRVSGGELDIEFDPELGFPTMIFSDDHKGIHSQLRLEVRDLQQIALESAE